MANITVDAKMLCKAFLAGAQRIEAKKEYINDTLYLINKGKKVISCDQSSNAINNIRKNFPEVYDTKCFNMLNGLPFEDNSYELVIADLCLHYFREEDTFKVLKEMGVLT